MAATREMGPIRAQSEPPTKATEISLPPRVAIQASQLSRMEMILDNILRSLAPAGAR